MLIVSGSLQILAAAGDREAPYGEKKADAGGVREPAGWLQQVILHSVDNHTGLGYSSEVLIFQWLVRARLQ